MEHWLESPRGRLLLLRERMQMRKVLPQLFGYRLLQIGAWDFDDDVLSASATLCQWVFAQESQAVDQADCASQPDVVFDGESLPVSSRCVDAVILPHSLETGASPHRLLREVDRVLCDHGQLVILGFNPYSPWALRQRFGQWFKRMPRTRRYYSLGRVCDWLDLLDYELLSASRFGVGFPYLPAEGIDIANAGLWRLPGAGAQAYAVVARKRVMAMTQQRKQQRRTSLAASGIPEPSARQNLSQGQGQGQNQNSREAA